MRPQAAVVTAGFRPRLAGLAPARVRSALALAALAVLVIAGVAIAVGGAAAGSSLVRTGGHVKPGWLGGPLQSLGGGLTFTQFLMLQAAMGAGYLILLAAGANLHVRALIAAVVVLHVAFLLAPPILSTDLFSYLSYARIGALHGVDPYVHGPSVVPHDPAYALTAWKHAASAYGPLFTLATYPLAYVSLPLAVWGLKLMAFAASLGCVALVWRIAGQLGHSPARAVAIFGLNPVLLVWTLGGGHNDLLMLMLALAAVSFVLAKRETLGGATLVAAAAVKATVGIALPFLILGARRGWRAALGAAGGFAVIVGIAAVGFPGHALGVVSVLRGSQSKLVAFDGVPNALAQLVGLPGVNKGEGKWKLEH